MKRTMKNLADWTMKTTQGFIRRMNIVAAKTGIMGRLADDAGEGFVDVLVKMLIVVVVGAILLAIMRTAVPQMFSDMMNKIREVFVI
jgi:hypothetical protein